MGRKQKKKRNKKYRPTYTTGGRVDMSTGGRVQAQEGGPQERARNAALKRAGQEDFNRESDERETNKNNFGGGAGGNTGGGTFGNTGGGTGGTGTGGTDNTVRTPLSNVPETSVTQGQREREQRVIESSQRAADIASGRTSLGDLGLEAQAAQIPTDIPEEQKLKGQDAFIKPLDKLVAEDYKAQPVISEQTTAGVAQPAVPTPQEIQAAQIEDVSTVPVEAQVAAAEGEVSTESLARAAGVDRVQPIEGAEVNIVPGALTDRVVGVISPEAKAEAAQNAGTTLSRVTRAKKQLTNAGLSETDIAEIGNDPEALEARLADFSEAERGIIAGLPEEALVSTQLDGLLSGIENGQIPTWAKPAVSAVEQMLAQRGMSASTVGRDSLLNAIIQSAIPLAQSNAQAIQQSVGQQRTIEAQVNEANAQRRQQVALDSANKVFQMNMAQFSADQQTALSNSKFLQTVGITEANFDQQSTVQNALLMSQANIAEADFYQKAQIQNAQAFLQMDLANMNAQQQSNILKAQQEQQRLLSNQAAENAAKQFNAASENQTQQFMTNLSTQVALNNAQRMDAMSQFNAVQANQAEARRAQRDADLSKFNAQLAASVDQYNQQQEFARSQFNAQNALVIEQSNVQWRRDITKVNTAAQQQVNMMNAQNAFSLTATTQAQLWQEVRDEFDYIWKSSENAANRETNIAVAGMQGEHSGLKNNSNMNRLKEFLNTFG